MPASYVAVDSGVLPLFITAVTVLVLTPGPDMAFMVATGLRDGQTGAARAALGITTGVGVHVVLTALGLGALLAAAPGVTAVIQIGGAAYLAVLAWRGWRSSGTPLEMSAHGPAGVFRRGFAVNITNPKIVLFCSAFLPQFLGDAADSPVAQLLVLGLVLQFTGLITDLAIGFAAGTIRDRVLRRAGTRTFLGRLAAGTYGALAAAMLVDALR